MADYDLNTPRLSGGLRTIDTKTAADATGDYTKDSIRESYGKERDLSKVTVIPATQAPAPLSSHKKQKVAVYCRVSTDGISQTTSFELQKNYYFNYVKKRPEWTLVAIYSDEGITATNTVHRQGLLQMLNDAREGKFDIIVVKNLSRLSRNLMDCMNIVKELRNLPKPVGILFESENMYTLGENMDFTIQILSLVAQEESHKKSEAMNASYRQRFELGNYMVPDILGFDRVGVNQIAVNPEEARTVQLIFMMYLANIDPATIAETLIMLGRKNHRHVRKDGTVTGGEVKWTADYIKSIMKNERLCGDVLAQKTYTVDWQMHKSTINNNKLPQYYARDHHDAIVSPADFCIAQRMLRANKNKWKYGLPAMEVYRSGFFKGFIAPAPNWTGFNSEDYNRAALSAYGMDENSLDKIATSIEEKEKFEIDKIQKELKKQASWDDDFVVFAEDTPEEEKQETPIYESFGEKVAKLADKQSKIDDRKSISRYDFSGMELVRPQMFSLRSKMYFTLDKKAITFSKSCFVNLVGDELDVIEHVRINYNPVEKLMIIEAAKEDSALTLNWSRENNRGNYVMKRCGCEGIAASIFQNMGWNKDYKYRVLGQQIKVDGKKLLVFYLDEPIIVVRAERGSAEDVENSEIMTRETLPQDTEDLDTVFDSGAVDKNLSRSRAIYFDNEESKQDKTFSVEDLGDDRFNPDTIRRIIQKGTEPVEGWVYLNGMAVMDKKGFTIFPAAWHDSFGTTIYERKSSKLRKRMGEQIDSPVEYGWTVGLDLPTMETVNQAIESLKGERNG